MSDNPKILTLDEIWDIYRQWGDDDSGITSKELLGIFYPDQDSDETNEIMAKTLGGLYANAFDEFQKFIIGLSDANRR